MPDSRYRIVFGVLGVLVLLVPDNLQAVQRRNIEVLTPRSGQRGTTVEVTMEGMHLRDARQVLFYRPGIKAVEFENLPNRETAISLHHGGLVSERIRCKFHIAPDCPLGEHPLRVRTKDTLTTVATFWVGPFPIVPEVERGGFEVSYSGGVTVVKENSKAIVSPNDTLETAQPIPINHTVAGEIKVTRELDHDYYKFEVREGERISVELDSVRLCDKAYAESEYDLLMRLLDSEGNVLAWQDDSDLHIQDPILSIRAPSTGVYYLHIRQQLYKGGRWIFYRAHIGTYARPTVAYPLGGQTGTRSEVRLLGDGLGEISEEIHWPEETGDYAHFPGRKGERPPSPLPLRVSPFPNLMEENKPAVGQLPVALNGVISEPGEEDTYHVRFSAEKNYRIRVFSRGNGSPLDSSIWIQHAEDASPEVAFDDTTWRDRGKPVIPNGLQRPELLDGSHVFRPSKDGVYTIGVHDLRGLGGERFVYRIEIEEARDVIHNHTVSWANDRFEINRTAGFIVPLDNRWTVNVYIAPGQGNSYDGPLRLVPVGLPEGITMIAPDYQPGMAGVPCQFIAQPGASPDAALFHIELQRLEGEGLIETSSQAYIPFINHSGGRSWNHLHLRRYALGLVETSPFTIEVESPAIPLLQSGELKLKVRIQRRNGFRGAVKMQPDWYSAGVSGGGLLEIPAGETEGEFILSASASARPGQYRMTMNGHTTDGDWESGVGVKRVSSDFYQVRVSTPFVAMRFAPAAIRRNETAEVKCRIQQLQPFEGTAKAILLGLPKGVSLIGSDYEISSSSKEVVFRIRANSEALLGQYRDMRCQLSYRIQGQQIRQLTAPGTLRVDPAIPEEER